MPTPVDVDRFIAQMGGNPYSHKKASGKQPKGKKGGQSTSSLSGISLTEIARDRVRVAGARARPRTPTYKVSVGYFDGFLGEGELSYGGPNAVARARLAGDIVKERLAMRGFTFGDLRIDLIGLDSLHGPGDGRPEPYEVRLRVAGRTARREAAEAVGWEVSALYTNGPSGGAGDFANVREILAVQSVLLPRELVPTRVELVTAP